MQLFLILLGGIFLFSGVALAGLSFLLPAECKDETGLEKPAEGTLLGEAGAGPQTRPRGWKHAAGWGGAYVWEPGQQTGRLRPGASGDSTDPSFIDEPLAESFELD